MELIDIETWNRKQHYKHFSAMKDPFFAVTIPVDVTKAYRFSKEKKVSFFGTYLHDCMKAINDVDALKLRIEDEKVVKYDVIHASPTLMRPDTTFGFSYIKFNEDLDVFLKSLEAEKKRVYNSQELYSENNGLDCIHCSALPWLSFTGHKEPVSGLIDSVPKLAFSKIENHNDIMTMHVSINVNHALVDGYDLGLFVEKFQHNLNK
ncbi:CatA-like O-acetyltransferase [Flavobacteriaceae bacterium LMO-SS05]